MSTETNITVEPISDDLDTFAAEFFGQNNATPEPASSDKEKIEDDKESDASKTDATHEEGDDDTTPTDDETDETEGDEEEGDKPEPKPKKNRAQERIEELNKKYRETERKLQELQAKLEQKEQTPAPTPEKQAENTKPSPTDTNEDGTDKYPLGEFDPAYILDLTDYQFEARVKAYEAKQAEQASQSQADEARAHLTANWQEKLGPAQERYPDFQEKGQQLVDTFAGIDSNYGEYLTAVIMDMDYGPDVLYYLSNNVDEANQIVQSGATKATIALGRIEAKFADAAEEKRKARPKVSQAPTPPPTNKGSAVAQADIADDTDDLDAFAQKFFKKRRK